MIGKHPARLWQRLLVPTFLRLFAAYGRRTGLFERAKLRPPELTIGPAADPQTSRYLLWKWHGWQMVLHHWHRSDHDRALHDHSGDSWSYILEGRYAEVFSHRWESFHAENRMAGDICFRRGQTPHRVMLPPGYDGRVWTLWFRMPPRREWGFWCPKGWRHNSDYITNRDYYYYASKQSEVGRGCD